jgi:hypothetical protein
MHWRPAIGNTTKMTSDTSTSFAPLQHRQLPALHTSGSSVSFTGFDGTVPPTSGDPAPVILDIELSGTGQVIARAGIDVDSDDERANRSDDEDTSHLVQNKPRQPRKITQKKKIEQASFGLWLEANRSRLSKKPEGRVVNNDQSVEYLVKTWEGQKIINNPRDYQMELFQRAKERNTIAVLDTGKFQSIHKPQPCRN